VSRREKLAVFDVDGTIFRKNLHFELLERLVFMGIFEKKVRNELVKLYGAWLNNEGTYEAYRTELVRLYEENIKGCRESDIIVASKEVANFNAKRIYIFAKQAIDRFKKSHIMLMISGSPVEIVKEYAQIFKFDAYFGSVYEVNEAGCYTGKTLFEPSKNKGAVIRKFADRNNLSLKESFGIGDTESDAKFLKLVENPIAFNPNLNLREIAEKEGWKIVVEKKDVIYEIV
jgi:HAD superfamily hydrolase (TIGR01490 family)